MSHLLSYTAPRETQSKPVALPNHVLFDLFGIFLTLDHTFNPHAILKFALKNSKFVIIQAHIDPELGRQHLFSITKDFPKFLKDMGIFSVDLTKLIKKDMLGKEIYMLATNYKKYKKVIDKIYNY